METDLFFQSPIIVFGLGAIALLTIGASLGGYIMSSPSRTHRWQAEPTVRPDCRPIVFTAHNVILDHSYVILDRENDEPTFVQEFFVLDRRMDYFLIRVRTWEDPYARRSQDFQGWTVKIQGDRPIRPEDLLAAYPA